jgi:hypothetical protein
VAVWMGGSGGGGGAKGGVRVATVAVAVCSGSGVTSDSGTVAVGWLERVWQCGHFEWWQVEIRWQWHRVAGWQWRKSFHRNSQISNKKKHPNLLISHQKHHKSPQKHHISYQKHLKIP